jgi:hypothetical protein
MTCNTVLRGAVCVVLRAGAPPVSVLGELSVRINYDGPSRSSVGVRSGVEATSRVFEPSSNWSGMTCPVRSLEDFDISQPRASLFV